MRTTRALAASITVLAVLGGCGGVTTTSPDTTRPPASARPATTTTTISPAALKAALLGPADVPGSKVSSSPPSGNDTDLTACFPGNPLGLKTDPNEVDGPDLELTQRLVGRSYGSGARTATPEQAAAFVTAFATPSGAACVLNASKKAIADDPTPPRGDGSSLTGSARTAPIADGGVVVLLDADAFMGPIVPGQGVALAQKIAARLP